MTAMQKSQEATLSLFCSASLSGAVKPYLDTCGYAAYCASIDRHSEQEEVSEQFAVFHC